LNVKLRSFGVSRLGATGNETELVTIAEGKVYPDRQA